MNYTAEQVAGLHQHRFAYLKVAEREHVLRITLSRPAKRNAMNPKMMEEIAFALAYAHYTPGVWAVVVNAEGPVWSAGADLKAFAGEQAPEDESTIPPATGEVLMGELFVWVHKPAIMLVHAPVLAGGHMLVGGALYVLAVREASFSLPEVKRGLFPFQVMEVLMQTLPPRRVLDWCVRGATLSAAEAHELGLVTQLVDTPEELEAAAQALLKDLFQNSPAAVRLGLEAYDKLRSTPRERAHEFLKAMLESTLQTADAREGLAAFREKRPPKWSGE